MNRASSILVWRLRSFTDRDLGTNNTSKLCGFSKTRNLEGALEA